MRRSFEPVGAAPLEGLHGFVYGAGPLGLFTAYALARNGARVTIAASSPIERGTGFVNAAGLIEPVASADPRVSEFLMSGLRFCQWAQPDPAWGIEPRRVLFLSDDDEKVAQNWMLELPSYRRATADEINGRRTYGAWFETYVLQPNIALTAVQRELRHLRIDGVKIVKTTSAASAAKTAQAAGADFFVLALGLGLAEIKDIEHVAGVNAMLSAGVGVTIVMPADLVNLDHVIMDDVDLGYLIPQRTQVVGGGTTCSTPTTTTRRARRNQIRNSSRKSAQSSPASGRKQRTFLARRRSAADRFARVARCLRRPSIRLNCRSLD